MTTSHAAESDKQVGSTENTRLWYRALAAMALSACAAGAVYLSTGPTLAFYLLGPFLIALMLPPLVTMEEELLPRILMAGAVIDGVGVAWVITVFGPMITFGQWLALYLVLIAWGFLLAGVVSVLLRLRVPATLASGIAVALSIAWLTWPVWLSAAIRSRPELANALVPFHPSLVVNSIVRHLGIWTEQAGYTLTALGQDVPYRLPGWTTIIFAFTICGIALMLLVHRKSALRDQQ